MVNVDTVYQRVLALANKEQRGYITPQEFNLFANQAQMDIFEQYFFDLDQALRSMGNKTNHADKVSIVEEKLQIFEQTDGQAEINLYTSNPSNSSIKQIPSTLYRINKIQYENVNCEILNTNDFEAAKNLPLLKPSSSRPIANIRNTFIRVLIGANDTDLVIPSTIIFYRKPLNVNWGYVVIQGEAQYAASQSTNFEIHASEETKLVMKILALAGITLKDAGIYQTATQEDIKNIQQEKI
jgi:hypothetical protein|tara:strand:+ start:56 stop:775 length:720 start_codon:yes stop_codon:yes gene_type:complete